MMGCLGPCHPDSTTISASHSSNLLISTDLLSLPLQLFHPWIFLLEVKGHSQTSEDPSLYHCHSELLILPDTHFYISLYMCFFHLKCPVQVGLSLWGPDPSLRQPNDPECMF